MKKKNAKKYNREAHVQNLQNKLGEMNLQNNQLKAQNRLLVDNMTLIHADLTEGLVEGGTQMSIGEQNFVELVALIGASKLHCMEAVRGAGAADFGMWLAQNMQHMHGQYQKLREEHFAAEENIKNGVNPGEVPANDEADTSRLPAHEQNP